MSKLRGAPVLLLLLLLVHCGPNVGPVRPTLGVVISSEVGTVIPINDANRMDNPFYLNISEIQDNRCPKYYTCPSAGEATVKFIIASTTYSLTIGQLTEFQQNNKTFILKLLDVTPYPVANAFTIFNEAVFIVTMK